MRKYISDASASNAYKKFIKKKNHVLEQEN